ncbi:MAG: NrdH-redoxin [Parcubacteria group bacterium]|nr:NrdH-redoxin [Parcubacteria group bacterium]
MTIKVIMYTTPTCFHCAAAREFFAAHEVAFSEIDLTKDQASHERILKECGRIIVPIFEIDNHFVVGYDLPALKHLLGIS